MKVKAMMDGRKEGYMEERGVSSVSPFAPHTCTARSRTRQSMPAPQLFTAASSTLAYPPLSIFSAAESVINRCAEMSLLWKEGG